MDRKNANSPFKQPSRLPSRRWILKSLFLRQERMKGKVFFRSLSTFFAVYIESFSFGQGGDIII